MRILALLTTVFILLPLPAIGRPAGIAPRRDAKAIAQCVREMRRPAVVLYLSLQPGYEDFAGLARFRFEDAAQVIVGYVTNGESTPCDVGDIAPNAVAGRRKEEASRACEMIGALPVFLNLADAGVVPERDKLMAIWNADTLSNRLARLLLHYRPDAVVVGGDRRTGQTRSFRSGVLLEQLLGSIRKAAAGSTDSLRSVKWEVTRVLQENGTSGAQAGVRKTIIDTAHAAADVYTSMRLQIASREIGNAREYEIAYPEKAARPSTPLDGLPFYGPVSRRFASTIRALAGTTSHPLENPSLNKVRLAIDSLDLILARDRSQIGRSDLRILASWKNSLEQLRCFLLGVTINFTVDSDNITRSQVVFLRFGSISPGDDSTRTRIFFPAAMNHEWGINESPESQFPLSSGREFRVITPRDLEYSYPSSIFGLDRVSLPTRFSFIIIHRDRTSDRDYVYRKEIAFRASPRRSLEVLSPVVRAARGQRLLVRMVNSNRDPYSGLLALKDSLFETASLKVDLRQRDEVRIDTLTLAPKSALLEGDYRVALSVTGGNSYPFTARSFAANVAAESKVGLLTAVEGGPVAVGLDRLAAHWRYLRVDRPDPGSWNECNVIVVDRDAFAATKDLPAWVGSLGSWIRDGGHLVVLAPTAGGRFPEGIVPMSFEAGPAIPPWTQLGFDSSSALVSKPNDVRGLDWDGWVISRALSHIKLQSPGDGRVLVQSVPDKTVLAAERAEGNGTVTFVALDLAPQLMNVHPGAHRILGNLLRPVTGSREGR